MHSKDQILFQEATWKIIGNDFLLQGSFDSTPTTSPSSFPQYLRQFYTPEYKAHCSTYNSIMVGCMRSSISSHNDTGSYCVVFENAWWDQEKIEANAERDIPQTGFHWDLVEVVF